MDAPEGCFESRKPRESDREIRTLFDPAIGEVDRDVRTEGRRWYAVIKPAGPGYEAVIKRVNEEAIARMQNGLGTRIAPKDDADHEDNQRRSKQRAKGLIRLYCKEIGVDHLLTLTTREDANTADVMLKRFKRFVQLYRKACGHWEYVAVLEPHPSNPKHLHIHVACVGKVNVAIARKIWCAILGGAGAGNVDAKYIKVADSNRHGPYARCYKIAGYISKYVTKDSAIAFNKKRYWASRVELQEHRRYLLDARTLEDALSEFSNRWGVTIERGAAVTGMFVFPYRDGCWIEVIPELGEDICPF